MLFNLYRQCIKGETVLLDSLRQKAAARVAKGDAAHQSQVIDQVEEVDFDQLPEGEFEFSEGDEEEESDEEMN